MLRLSHLFDFAIIFSITLAGFYRLPILIVVGIGALAAGPIARAYATARTRPHVDARHILRSIKIDAALYASAGSIGAYLVGRLVALWSDL